MNGEGRAECYFLDVGQGTSNVLYLGDGRAIVIDGGPSSSARVPLTLLKTLGVTSIAALVVSHNDADHLGGACEIFAAYHAIIKCLILLIDRRTATKDVKIVVEALRRNRARRAAGLSPIKLLRLERDGEPRDIYRDDARGLSLKLLYPDFESNLEATRASAPNATSAVLKFECGRGVIVFPGDAPIDAWKWIHRQDGATRCDVLAVPHHGGITWESRSTDEIDGDLRWLFSEAVPCDYAIISAGTTNGHGHPRREVVRALRASKAADGKPTTILCTQLTDRCCADPAKRGFVPIHPNAASLSRGAAGSGQGVACAGTVLVELKPGSMEVHKLDAHQARVDGLPRTDVRGPLCRP